MANLWYLKNELWAAQKELMDLRKDTRSFDPFKEFTTRELINDDLYFDSKKAITVLNKILRLQEEIRRAEMQKASGTKDEPLGKMYEYTQAGEKQTTPNHAIAARYNAQHRFFKMTKFKQTMSRLNGQYKKFEKLWNEAAYTTNSTKNEEVAKKLDNLF